MFARMYSLFIAEVKLPFEASKLLFIPIKGIKFNITNLTFNKVLQNIKLCELNTKFNSLRNVVVTLGVSFKRIIKYMKRANITKIKLNDI